ncbi:MAG: hypothetical protein ACJAX5_003411 [Patiriisocius sp.]|jgi:hypothetical protein
MNKREFDDLLASYGTHLSLWPEAKRGAAKSALASHPAWQSQIAEARRLDELLDKELDELVDDYHIEPSATARLEQQILNKTIYRKTTLDKLLDWLSPAQGIWKPALAACLPILVGVSIGLAVDVGEQYSLEDELTLTGLESESWESQIE